MRFLITLLALITGFSAADAARVRDCEAQAAVALDAAIVLETAEVAQVSAKALPANPAISAPAIVDRTVDLTIATETPVSRADIAHK